jgi:AcrR family transcriptional regulator
MKGRTGGAGGTDTRQRIREASLDLFAEGGFEGTGINEIAARVGITKSVIYYHYKNKEAILADIAEGSIGQAIELKRDIARRFGEDIGRGRDLTAVVDTILAFVLSHKKVLKVLLMESIKGGSSVPLLDFWDANLGLGAEVSRQVGIDLSTEAARQALLEGFFMLVLPVVGYAVLEEKWAKRNGASLAGLRRAFATAFKVNMEELWFGRFLGASARRGRGAGASKATSGR